MRVQIVQRKLQSLNSLESSREKQKVHKTVTKRKNTESRPAQKNRFREYRYWENNISYRSDTESTGTERKDTERTGTKRTKREQRVTIIRSIERVQSEQRVQENSQMLKKDDII